jgi:hypothetical protein
MRRIVETLKQIRAGKKIVLPIFTALSANFTKTNNHEIEIALQLALTRGAFHIARRAIS